jgi:hypothetical protein
MFLILVLSLLPDGAFKSTKLLCQEYKYTYTRESDTAVYIRAEWDYKTEYTDEAKLRTEIKLQCGK